MSVVKRIIDDSKEKLKVDELLAAEFESAGYGGITLTKTPLGAQINLFTMRPGRVIGKRGRSIKAASARLEEELGLENPQITVVEIEVPELNPRIMAARISNALERGIHYRRSIFWSLRRIMESGAIGCEIVIKGPLRSSRGRYEKVSEGYIPKSGDPALKQAQKATIHVKMKRGTVGVTVTIVPSEAKFPDKVDLTDLPEIDYSKEEIEEYEGPYESEEQPLVEPEPEIATAPPVVQESVPPEPEPPQEIKDTDAPEEVEEVQEEIKVAKPTDKPEVADEVEQVMEVVPTDPSSESETEDSQLKEKPKLEKDSDEESMEDKEVETNEDEGES